MIVKFRGRVTAIRQEERNIYEGGTGKEAIFKTVRGDWRIELDHMYSFPVGAEEPRCKFGDKATLTLEIEK